MRCTGVRMKTNVCWNPTLSSSIFLGIMGDDGLSNPFPWPVTSRTTCNHTKIHTHQWFPTSVNIVHHTGGPFYKSNFPLVQYCFWQQDTSIACMYNRLIYKHASEWGTVFTWSHFSACSLLCMANTSASHREERIGARASSSGHLWACRWRCTGWAVYPCRWLVFRAFIAL